MQQVRAVLRDNNLSLVIDRIYDSDQDYGGILRKQQQFVSDDLNAALVISTDNYGYSDKWHYDTEGHIDLGKEFAKAILMLLIFFSYKKR